MEHLNDDTPFHLFHTAPSSPFAEIPASPVQQYYTPPTSPYIESLPLNPPALTNSPPHPHLPLSFNDTLHTDDPFPIASVDFALDIALDEEGLSTLEKIYLFSRSRASFHRIFIAHALPSYLHHVTPQEATEYVLPLLSGLAMDDDEQVKEALAAELVHIIWWFLTHCQAVPDDRAAEEVYTSSSPTVTVSVQAFTPILGTLLLSSNPLVGGAARFAVVNLLSRMKSADDTEDGIPPHPHNNNDDDDDDDDNDFTIGLFTREARILFQQEVLQQLVIGMGRLDVDMDMDVDPIESTLAQDDEFSNWDQQKGPIHVVSSELDIGQECISETSQQSNKNLSDNINPYFPVVPVNYAVSSPASSTASTPSPSTSSSGSSPGISYSNNSLTPQPSTSSPMLVLPPQGSSTLDSPSRNDRNDDFKVQSSLLPGSPEIQPQIKPPTDTPLSGFALHGNERYTDDMFGSEEGEDEQAAVGRLSSMSLMAAVTASGSLGEATKLAFVKEVERVGRDPVYWVRREASFALGALAKVVPEEVVICSLLPLFDTLRWDSVYHVRHSVLFALPAILARLSPEQRHSLALRTVVSLSSDEYPSVRSGVLEALGEVLYTFHKDSGGPPQELVNLFLGRKEDRRVRDGQQSLSPHRLSQLSPLESFYKDPERPLICAFNFPAVTLTLGRERWGELREAYLDIAANRSWKVRRTLAASLGEMAKIIGQENSEKDLVGVWWDAIRCDDEEVRIKAIECLLEFVQVLRKESGQTLLQGLLTVWDEKIFRAWRERETITKDLSELAHLAGLSIPSVIRGILVKALEDQVAAVRETAILALPKLWKFYSLQLDVLSAVQTDLRALAQSSIYRRRMTFMACMQALILAFDGHFLLNESSFNSIFGLANDSIEGVRIAVARFVAVYIAKRHREGLPILDNLHTLVHHLAADVSHEVQSYVSGLVVSQQMGFAEPLSQEQEVKEGSLQWRRAFQLATFSRPPPMPPVPPLGNIM